MIFSKMRNELYIKKDFIEEIKLKTLLTSYPQEILLLIM